METLVVAALTFVACFLVVPGLLALLRGLGFYTILQERRCRVYVLFGKVVLVLDLRL